MKKDFLELIDLVNAGEAPLEKIITNVYSFHDAAKAFDDFAHNPGNMLKVVFDFADISECTQAKCLKRRFDAMKLKKLMALGLAGILVLSVAVVEKIIKPI